MTDQVLVVWISEQSWQRVAGGKEMEGMDGGSDGCGWDVERGKERAREETTRLTRLYTVVANEKT